MSDPDKVGQGVAALLAEADKVARDAVGLERAGDRWASARLEQDAERLRRMADDHAAAFAERSR